MESKQGMEKYALIMAGGSGLRMGAGLPKQFMLLNGKPLLMHTMAEFKQYDSAIRLVLVLPEKQVNYWENLCREYDCDIPYTLAVGGTERFYSVQNGLRKIAAELTDDSYIAVHDAVRPLVDAALIGRCFEKALECGTAIPVLPLTESIRRCDGERSQAEDRNAYCSVQTPQVFHGKLLVSAYERGYRDYYTDDASVVEASGYAISLVEGSRKNIKITRPEDLFFAKYWMGKSSKK